MTSRELAFEVKSRGSQRPCSTFSNKKFAESWDIMGGRRAGVKGQSKITPNIWCLRENYLLEGETYKRHSTGLVIHTSGTKKKKRNNPNRV